MVICALSKKNAFLEINHSYKQKDYVDWKFNNLKSLVKSPPKFRVGNEGRTAYCFYTRQLPVLTELFYNFYEKKVKIIPKNLKLDPLVIAV
jgi:hypothetical protein